MIIDPSTAFGLRVATRLREERIIWIVTTAADGTPQPSPVWFLWTGETVLIHSQTNVPKVHNIARNPRVALHFDGDGVGGDIVVLTGTARVARDPGPTAAYPAYVEKYRADIARIGLTEHTMVAHYNTAIYVTPTTLRGH